MSGRVRDENTKDLVADFCDVVDVAAHDFSRFVPSRKRKRPVFWKRREKGSLKRFRLLQVTLNSIVLLLQHNECRAKLLGPLAHAILELDIGLFNLPNPV